MTYQPVIGLEIHTELKTSSKMFCPCPNQPDPPQPNLYICPICLGHPGSLPVINQEAVKLVIRTGLALNCQIAQFSKFDRKNYFYPDLPKGYQISQYDLPLCTQGFLKINQKKVRIIRIHLEEDTGKLIHQKGQAYSLIDFNRAGVPLMELVTQPEISSGQEARQFCEELQLILRYLAVSEAEMEKGQMRCEVNISLGQKRKPGTKVEIKNLNSFRAVERAVDYEIERQRDLLKGGERIVQETRGWDETKQKTFSQRIKEEAEDYRYFPEPDLPPLVIGENQIEEIKKSLPELPSQRRQRFEKEYQLLPQEIKVLVANKGLADYFEKVVSELKNWLKTKPVGPLEPLIKLTVNYLLTELQKLLVLTKTKVGACRISPEDFAELILLIKEKTISSSAAQAVLQEMFKTGADPSHIVKAKKLNQLSDEEALTQIIEKVIKENPQPVKDYQQGRENALQFLVGLIMKESQGRANPQLVKDLLKKELG